MVDFTQTQIAAALSESVYRRADQDQTINPAQSFGATNIPLVNVPYLTVDNSGY